MQALPKEVLFLAFYCLYCLLAQAQTTPAEDQAAYINFSLGHSTLAHQKYQQATLLGCKTTVVVDSAYMPGFDGLVWDQSNQVISNIPYGPQFDKSTLESYFVSKYYIASPPVFTPPMTGNTIYDIGLVTPDEFELKGDKPVQLVYLSYDILQPMYIDYIPVVFDSALILATDTIVPFRVEGVNFPWLDTLGIQNAKGASGIGYLNTCKSEKLFLPYYYEKIGPLDSVKTYLDFEISILNDILLGYEICFGEDTVNCTSKVNLKHMQDATSIYLSLKKTGIVPDGCSE